MHLDDHVTVGQFSYRPLVKLLLVADGISVTSVRLLDTMLTIQLRLANHIGRRRRAGRPCRHTLAPPPPPEEPRESRHDQHPCHAAHGDAGNRTAAKRVAGRAAGFTLAAVVIGARCACPV